MMASKTCWQYPVLSFVTRGSVQLAQFNYNYRLGNKTTKEPDKTCKTVNESRPQGRT